MSIRFNDKAVRFVEMNHKRRLLDPVGVKSSFPDPVRLVARVRRCPCRDVQGHSDQHRKTTWCFIVGSGGQWRVLKSSLRRPTSYAAYFARTLLVEDQIRPGDVVELGVHAGFVEEVTLRYVQLRDYGGRVHFLPNGLITSVIHMGRGHAQAVIDIGVASNTNLDDAMAVMKIVASEMRADPAYTKRILDDLEMAGVERWADSSSIIRARFRVGPLEQWATRREYLGRLKYAFDDKGIEIPFPQVTLHQPAPCADRQPVRVGFENADVKPVTPTMG